MLCLRETVQSILDPAASISMYIDFLNLFQIVCLLDVSLDTAPQRFPIEVLIHEMHRTDGPFSLSTCCCSFCHCHKRDDFSLLTFLLIRLLHMNMILVGIHMQFFHFLLLRPFRFLFRNREFQNMISDSLAADRSVRHNLCTSGIRGLCSFRHQLCADVVSNPFVLSNAQHIVQWTDITATPVVIVVIPLQVQLAKFCQQ